jgi:hypothetical protein
MGMVGVQQGQTAGAVNGAAKDQSVHRDLHSTANSLAHIKRSRSCKQTRSNRSMVHAQHSSKKHASSPANLHRITNRRFIE